MLKIRCYNPRMDLWLKRALDVTVSAVLLLALSPLLLVVAALIRVRLGSPIFFKQVRIGRGERAFCILKFRTMLNGDAPDHERVTPFGQWLRKTSIDELPELWNILIGDMSLVGPRPLLPQYLEVYRPREKLRHRMRPGITGLAQVNGRNALSWDARLELDAHYVEQFSFKRDLEILWRTVSIVLKREGISAQGHVTMPALDAERSKGNA